METDQPVFEGYVFFPPSGKLLKKSWQKKYCVLYRRSSSGIARIEIFGNEAKTGQAKIVILEDMIKITPKPSNIINIVTKNSDMEFGTAAENLNNWFEALKSVAFPDESSWVSSIEQDNDLYCSADEGVFYVKLHPSDASQRCNLASKNYILIVTSSALQLRSEDNTKLYTWPFSYIRKYGYKDGKFNFEAGRKCASGEGVFYLEYPNHNEIYRCLSAKMKNMRKLLNGESTSSLIDCGDMQLHAALSMEAGSRSPLPLSMSAQSSFSESSKASLGLHFSPSVSSAESQSIVKVAPMKPPRKSVPLKNVDQILTPMVTINTVHEYADVSVGPFNPGKYDTIENRKDAWKTMGVDDPTHSELLPSGSENIYSSWGTSILKKSLSEMKLKEIKSAPAMITEPTTSPDSQYYDCLQHFGSTNTLNNSSGYKKIPQVNKSIENLVYTEDSHSNYEDQYASWGGNQPVKKSVNEMKLAEKTHAPTVISEPILLTDDQGYDHLNFFGQSSGLPASSDYKPVITSTSTQAVKAAFNMYEEVNVMESARSADDSHIGYGRIKKDNVSGMLKEDENNPRTFSVEELKEPQRVAHHFKNHQLYAVVSPKSKRV